MVDPICLIVDDEPAIRAYLKAILQLDRFQSLEASTAAQALRIVQKLDGRIDLLLSDVRMPGDMDGIDLAYSVRNLFPTIPVILISGYAVEPSTPATPFHVIQKPFVPETILAAARQLVNALRAKAADDGE